MYKVKGNKIRRKNMNTKAKKTVEVVKGEVVKGFEQKLVAAKLQDSSEFVIPRDGDRDLKFRGWEIAGVREDTDDRWSAYRIFLTIGHNIVMSKEYNNENCGERNFRDCIIAEGRYKVETEITTYFGYYALSKKLYAVAEIDATEVIE